MNTKLSNKGVWAPQDCAHSNERVSAHELEETAKRLRNRQAKYGVRPIELDTAYQNIDTLEVRLLADF